MEAGIQMLTESCPRHIGTDLEFVAYGGGRMPPQHRSEVERVGPLQADRFSLQEANGGLSAWQRFRCRA